MTGLAEGAEDVDVGILHENCRHRAWPGDPDKESTVLI
jgi:hypothetical protein